MIGGFNKAGSLFRISELYPAIDWLLLLPDAAAAV